LEYQKLQEKFELLEQQNDKLIRELSNAVDHSNELCEKIVLVEMSRDKLRAKLNKTTIETGINQDALYSSLKDSKLAPEVRQQLEKAKSMQEKLSALEHDRDNLECTLSDTHFSLTTVTELKRMVWRWR